MPFLPPMLCSRLENAARLTDPRYVAEPKLDGQRAQLHVHEGRTTHLYSRPGHDLLRHPGTAWLREIPCPFVSAVLDGEAVADDGHEGIQAVFHEQKRVGGDMALLPFDVRARTRQPQRHAWGPGSIAGTAWRTSSPA